jgi:predicted PurR-regulated permease PerM
MLIKILSSPLTISAVNLLSINFTLKTLTFFDQELLSNRKYATSPQITHSKVKVGKKNFRSLSAFAEDHGLCRWGSMGVEGVTLSVNWHTIISLIILAIIVLFILWKLTWPAIQTEITNLIDNGPVYIDKVRAGAIKAINLLEKHLGFLSQGTLEKGLQQKINSLTSEMKDVSSLVKIVKGLARSVIIIPFVTFFLLKEGRKIKKMLIGFVPNKYFETFLTLFHKIDQQISNYIGGQLIDSFIVALMAIIGFYLVGINYAFLLGVILGMMSIIPYIGSLIGFISGSLLILIDTGSTVDLFKFIGVFVFLRLIDSIIVSSMALSKSVHVPPLMVIIVVMLGGFFHGIWGMLLAVPLYCSMKVAFQILDSGLIEYGNW